MAAVGGWFIVGTGSAIGIASAGQALGQGGVPFVSSFLIEAFGVSGAFGITGLFMLVTLVPLALLLRPPPATDPGQRIANTAEEKTLVPTKVVIVWMSLATILCCTCMSVPLIHLVPLIQDRGFVPEEASGVIFVMLLVAILGRLAFGKLADVIGALPAYLIATAWMTLLVFGFVYVENLRGFYFLLRGLRFWLCGRDDRGPGERYGLDAAVPARFGDGYCRHVCLVWPCNWRLSGRRAF